MPRDAGGNYTLPAGNPVLTGTVITSTWANPTMADIANELTNSLSRTGQGGMLVPIEFANGTVNDPSMTFTTEPSLGLYRASAGVLGIASQGIPVGLFKGATGNIAVDGAAPVDAADLTRKDYVDAADAVLDQKIDDAVAVASLGEIPIGGVVMFNAVFANIPVNFQLCDGTNSTPDMTDRFVYGTNTEGELEDQGGVADTVLPSHTHVLTAAPNHTHGVAYDDSGSGSGAADNASLASRDGTITSDGGGAHNHAITSEGASPTGMNLPPYIKLAFIQRMS